MIQTAENHATIIGTLDEILNDFVTIVAGLFETISEVHLEKTENEIIDLLGITMAKAIAISKEQMKKESEEK